MRYPASEKLEIIRLVEGSSLPELIGCRGLVLELIGSLHDDESGASDQIVGLQEPIDRGFGHKILLRIGKSHRQFPG